MRAVDYLVPVLLKNDESDQALNELERHWAVMKESQVCLQVRIRLIQQ